MRQTALGRAAPAVPARLARPDPLALPIRFTAPDAAADGRLRQIEIDREHVLVMRRLQGMAIRVRLSVNDFVGVAMRMNDDGAITLTLEHPDRNLSVELSATHEDDLFADWALWGRVLGLPLLVSDFAGKLVPAFPSLGAVRLGKPGPRRRRRNAIAQRRSRFAMRRRIGMPASKQTVHRKLDIISRD
ncbi:MAG: hypothetical protein QOD74_891 [Variibacter sp.]|nr:hypothetical protein [Variibacter sp.]